LVSEHVRHDRAVELWHRTARDASRMAVLLGAGVEDAHRIASQAFRRASWLWMEHRDNNVFESWLLRFVVRAVWRRRRQLRVLHFLSVGRWARSTSLPVERGVELWDRLQVLRPRPRAATVLAHYNGLTVGGVADVLQTSAGGAAALLDRAVGELGAGRDGAIELNRALRRIADRVPSPDFERKHLDRTHLAARVAGVLFATAVGAATLVAGFFVATQMQGTEVSEAGDGSSQGDAVTGAEFVPEIPASEFLGAPEWCPSPRSEKRMLPLRSEDAVEAVGVATRLNLGLIKGYRSSVRHLFEHHPGAPNPFSWPTATDVVAPVVMSAPAEANRELAASCGNFVARRTWEVIFEPPGPPSHDGVAFFLVRRSDGINVWGTYAGSAQ
jgi:DNA-directed RNA polymerase specialized sigma24 family protein